MSQYHTNIQVDDVEDVPVVVDYEACSPCKGSRDRYGVPMEPDDPGHIEINSVRLIEDGREITLTTKAEERMEEEIAEWLAGVYERCDPDDDDNDSYRERFPREAYE